MNKPVLQPEMSDNRPGWTEEERLNALDAYKILDTPDEDDFNDIVRLASRFCNAPVSLISLLDRDRQWFKAKVGTDIPETPLDISFCKHTVFEDGVFVVPDATKDPRFVNNSLVTGDTHVRFYAGAPLKTPDGVPIGTLCILDTRPRVLTPFEEETLQMLARQVMTLLELKRALREKHKSEERLHFALDASTAVGTWDWDMRQDLIFADARFCQLYGVDPALGRTGAALAYFTRAIHADDKDRVGQEILTAVETGGEFASEYRVYNINHEMRWVFVRGKAFRDDDGTPLRFPGAAVDITDRKRAERKQAARVELNDRLRDVRNSSDVTFIAAEIIGRTLDASRAGYGELSEDGTMITLGRDWTNGIVRSISGTHEFKAYGHEFAESIKRGEIIVVNDVLDDRRFTEGLDRLKAIQIRSLINVSLIEDGQPRALFFIHDLKPRRWRDGEIELVVEMAMRTWSEAERVHAGDMMMDALKKAEEASIAKSEFLANMSHEIRTPMNAIIGLSNILATEKLTPRQQGFVDTLQLSAESLLSLINDLLDISKIEARTVELEAIPFDMHQIIQEVISMMNVKATEKGLTLTMDSECANGQMFTGDPARIRQIVLNLCSNAIKFTEKGGIDISIRAHETDIPNVEKICIIVRDSGIGIAADKIDTIFEKFSQADTSINRRYGGTGLGLAITKTLTGLMGGTIHVESAPGQGSAFTVCIPLPLTDREKLETQSNITTQGQLDTNFQKRILLVEDYAPNVLVAGTFLEEFGFEWDSAKSGREAVDKFMSGVYAAVLMDVQMFGMNGFEATKLIRDFEAQNGLPRTPIIGMTAHALSGDREKCLSVGMDDYLSKPFNPDDLQARLQALTGIEIF